jgi:hypothetical protein
MKNLAMSELMAGANFWDAPGHSMAGSNNMATRIQIFHWIAANQSTFSSPRVPVGKVGVYFSDITRNYYPDEFIHSYQGVLLLLLRSHVQFQIVTPRTLASFHGTTLVLPDVRVLSPKEIDELHNLAASCKIISTRNTDPRLASFKQLVQIQDDPGSSYLALAQKDFDDAAINTQSQFLKSLNNPSDFSIHASPDMVVYIATVQNQTHWFFANFKGLKQGTATVPVPEQNVVLEAPLRGGTTLHLLPFLGTQITLNGTVSGDRVKFTIPEINRGAVAWTDHDATTSN